MKRNIIGYGIREDKIFPIQAFSRQYLQFEQKELGPNVEKFFRSHDPVICCYVFYRPEFFIEDIIQAVNELVTIYPGFGLIIMGSTNDSEPFQEMIEERKLQNNILLAGDQDHDAFLTIINRSKLYLRTPYKDGVCSSVLEALSLKVPVVACDNGSRPPGTVKYKNRDINDMVQKICYVLENYEKVKREIIPPEIVDTIADEIRVLSL